MALKQTGLIFVVGDGEITTIEAGAADKSLMTSKAGEDIPTAR
jgi:hypothetical protein